MDKCDPVESCDKMAKIATFSKCEVGHCIFSSFDGKIIKKTLHTL